MLSDGGDLVVPRGSQERDKCLLIHVLLKSRKHSGAESDDHLDVDMIML